MYTATSLLEVGDKTICRVNQETAEVKIVAKQHNLFYALDSDTGRMYCGVLAKLPDRTVERLVAVMSVSDADFFMLEGRLPTNPLEMAKHLGYHTLH